jgi:micrococcal nuclease
MLFVFFIGKSEAEDFVGKVVNVIDGNTFEILNEDNEVIKFMLSEVDCPEIGQELAEEAKAYIEKMVLKKKVIVEVSGKDRWGNKLAIIRLKNGTSVHEALLKEGLAWANEKSSSEVETLQVIAQQNKKGIWSTHEPTPPWIYRRKQTMLQPKSR